MKNLLLFIACIPIIIACNITQQVNNTEVEEYVKIGFRPTMIEIEESPMYSTRSSSSDLYGLQICQFPQSDTEGAMTEACWVTDDLSKSPILLRKNKKFICYLVYVPNGKNIIYSDGKSYGNPFFHLGPGASPEYDVIHYGTYHDINFARHGASRTKDKNDYRVQTNIWNQVDIYYGIKEINTNTNEDIQIDLYRMMFGLNIEATNFTKGKIVVYYEGSYESTLASDGYIYELTPSQPSLDIELELPYMPWDLAYGDIMGVLSDLKTYTSPNSISIDHISETNKITSLFKENVDTKRMTRYTIKLDVEDLLNEVEDIIKPNIIQDEWSDESL